MSDMDFQTICGAWRSGVKMDKKKRGVAGRGMEMNSKTTKQTEGLWWVGDNYIFIYYLWGCRFLRRNEVYEARCRIRGSPTE